MTPRFRHGLMIGKFYPPHIGHLSVIENAACSCDRVSVVIAATSKEQISLAARVDWVGWASACWPNVSVIGTMDDHPIDYEDPAVWDAHEAVFRKALGEIAEGVDVDTVFSGEDYGDELARRFDAAHVRVRRQPDGVSGTRLRTDVLRHWQDLIEPARVGLARRIVVLGAESTGTTTLAHELAITLGGKFVPEYGRTYSAAKLAGARQSAHAAEVSKPWLDQIAWRSEEFEVIAARQTAAIDAACLSSPIVVADTDALATSIWHERYLETAHPEALTLANATPPDLYILTSPDGVPFHQDGLRDGEAIRADMHTQFKAALAQSSISSILVSGSRKNRIASAVEACGPLVNSTTWFAPAWKHSAYADGTG